MSSRAPASAALVEQWRRAWPAALAAWSKYTRLRDPRLCTTTVEAASEGLNGSFAMIRLLDQSVVVDLEAVQALGLGDFAVEILAHEIGHHVFVPATAADQFRILARMSRGLPTFEAHSALVANLYTDLLVNDRLQREAGLRMAGVFHVLDRAATTPASAVWTLVMRIYEHLWELAEGSLSGPSAIEGLASDAWLGARVIRVYAAEPVTGAGRFATLLLPYLVMDQEAGRPPGARIAAWFDTQDAAAGCDPAPGQGIDSDFYTSAVHPANDPRIIEEGSEEDEDEDDAADIVVLTGQAHDPFELGEALADDVTLTGHELAMRRYRELALPHLVPFAGAHKPQAPAPQFEAVEPWAPGEPLDEIYWMATLLVSPVPIPGFTIMRRTSTPEGAPAGKPAPAPFDLDLYVDSSASMPNPQTEMSYLALAGAVIALSALRAGASVQVTLWSGKQDVMRTSGFVRIEDDILRVLTGFFGNMTDFPIHRLRDTYAEKPARPTHILMISDNGITTMFDQDERGNSGWDIAAKALAAGGAGGTMALKLRKNWEAKQHWWNDHATIARARDEQGWEIHPIERMEDLLAFARTFSMRHYDPARHG